MAYYCDDCRDMAVDTVGGECIKITSLYGGADAEIV